MLRLESILYKELKELGFKRLTRQKFYLKMNDIIVHICVECPSGLVYVWFAIIPLFLPCPGYIYLSYGNRFNHMFPDCHIIVKEAEDDVKQRYCGSLVFHYENDLLPIVQNLSTAKELFDYSSKVLKPFRRSYGRYIRCTREDIKYLCMYSSLYAKEYLAAQKAAREYYQFVDKKVDYLIDELKEKLKAEAKTILDLLEKKQYDEIERMLEKNIQENLALFGDK